MPLEDRRARESSRQTELWNPARQTFTALLLNLLCAMSGCWGTNVLFFSLLWLPVAKITHSSSLNLREDRGLLKMALALSPCVLVSDCDCCLPFSLRVNHMCYSLEPSTDSIITSWDLWWNMTMKVMVPFPCINQWQSIAPGSPNSFITHSHALTDKFNCGETDQVHKSIIHSRNKNYQKEMVTSQERCHDHWQDLYVQHVS